MRDQALLTDLDRPDAAALSPWRVAVASLLLIFIGWGAPYLVAVALKPMAADLGAERSVPSLASALAYFGSGIGGIFMGWWADRSGALWPALFCSLMIGLLGNGGIFAPLMANTSRLFTRRRGTALALVASGQQIAGAVWPPVFRYGVDAAGWRAALFLYGVFALVMMPPLCLALRRRLAAQMPEPAVLGMPHGTRPLGLPPNLLQALLCAAIVCCCIAMAMPMSHVVAL